MTLDEALLAAMLTVTPAAYSFPARNPPAVYATYQRVTGRRHATLNSGAGAPTATFQVDVWGQQKGQVRTLADALIAALPQLLKAGDLTDNPDDYEEDTKLHRASFDIAIWA